MDLKSITVRLVLVSLFEMKPSIFPSKEIFLIFAFIGHVWHVSITAQSVGLFDSDSILHITLKGNVRDLLNDRSSTTPTLFPITLHLKNEDGTVQAISVQMKTRGHFRRLKENCTYPPLLIQFGDPLSLKNTLFENQKKLKLVMPCRGDEYVVKEWMVYKLYNLVTPMSFRARLVRLTLEDSKAKKPVAPFYAMILEDEEQVASRNHSVMLEKKIIPQQAQMTPFLTTAVFEYMIGNTDWGVQYLQNIKLIAKDTHARPIIIPYDFDHAGIVSAPYANPAPELKLSSIKERRYRGYCIQSLNQYDEVIALFNNLKPKFYQLYSNSPLLEPKAIKSTLLFLDDFYTTINNTKVWQKEFTYPCDKNGTGNVVIKGLRTD